MLTILVFRVRAQITLLIISVAGFGRRLSWKEDAIAPAGHEMTFKASRRKVGHYARVHALIEVHTGSAESGVAESLLAAHLSEVGLAVGHSAYASVSHGEQ